MATASVAVAELGSLGEDLVGEHVKHGGRRRPLLGARHAEQGIEIDKARRKLGAGLDALAELERELALENLRVPLAWTVRSKSGSSARSGVALSGPFSSKQRRLVARRGVGCRLLVRLLWPARLLRVALGCTGDGLATRTTMVPS